MEFRFGQFRVIAIGLIRPSAGLRIRKWAGRFMSRAPASRLAAALSLLMKYGYSSEELAQRWLDYALYYYPRAHGETIRATFKARDWFRLLLTLDRRDRLDALWH